eukprot:TRINITY_DN70929_c0_g1_i1.p1 TRINITY_DN70929_c0_g1~~TRINITY_DN70929_c0_g1_i1.p1  ORF type:complete len:287 (+),score=91.22 TRINITY_DN70929_c0_g1_i1:86-862(+)
MSDFDRFVLDWLQPTKGPAPRIDPAQRAHILERCNKTLAKYDDLDFIPRNYDQKVRDGLAAAVQQAAADPLASSGRAAPAEQEQEQEPAGDDVAEEPAEEEAYANGTAGGRKPAVLFLCTGNSCRSQMAEGWARYYLGDGADVYSAGLTAKGLNPLAVQVMAEKGIDISMQQSQEVTEFDGVPIDVVVTVCGHAHETCPMFPSGAEIVHQGFDDPPHLAADLPEEEALPIYRRVRDEIAMYVREEVPGMLAVELARDD